MLVAADCRIVKVRAHVIFDGRVQGVFFRSNAKKCADSLGVTGWVRNTADGKVEAVFEGEEEKVKRAVDWCSTEQPYARVESKSARMQEATDEFDSFDIRY